MSSFLILTLSILITSVIGITLIAEAIRHKVGVKLFACLYIVLALYWAHTGIGVIKESVTCSLKEKP